MYFLQNSPSSPSLTPAPVSQALVLPTSPTPQPPVVSTPPLSPPYSVFSPAYNPLGSSGNSPSPSYIPSNVRSVLSTPPVNLTCIEDMSPLALPPPMLELPSIFPPPIPVTPTIFSTLAIPTLLPASEPLIIHISPEVIKEFREFCRRSENVRDFLLRSNWFLQLVYEFSFNPNLRRVTRTIHGMIRPIHYLDMYGPTEIVTLPHYVRRAVINHCRIYHDGQFTNVDDYLLAATVPSCRCFGLTRREDVDPSRTPHALLNRFDNIHHHDDLEVCAFHFLAKYLTCMHCDVTTCCGAKCSSPANSLDYLTLHKRGCPFVLAFKSLTRDEVCSLYRVVISDIRSDIDDLNDPYYSSHFNMSANVFTPGSHVWHFRFDLNSSATINIIHMQNELRFNVYYDQQGVRETVDNIAKRMGIGRYCTLCRNSACRMFCRCVVHNHYHAINNYHPRVDGNYPCGVVNSVDLFHSVEEVLAWEDGLSDEDIETSKNYLINERMTHASNFYIGGTTDEETDMDSEHEESDG